MFDTKVSLYPIMILLSLLSNVIVVIMIYKKYNFNKDEIIGALLYENIGIIFGAKLLSYIENYKLYGQFNFLKIGISSYGGVIGAIICLIIFGLQFKKELKQMLYVFMPSIPLMYAIGKIGCFLVGCCYGIKYNGVGSILYKYSIEAPSNTRVFPVQLLETILFLLIFILIIKMIKSNLNNLKILSINFILCGFAKFITDFLRMSHVNKILSLNQVISLFFVILGITIYLKNKRTINLLI